MCCAETQEVAAAGHAGRLDQTLQLADGRRLGFAEYGCLGGKPVLVFHGLPGSRLPSGGEPAAGRIAGLRFIGVDRPGFGLSSYQRGRKLLDWPRDVAALADFLGLERFSVVGGSAGGPYALACAYSLADRVAATVVVNGMAPFDRPGAQAGYGWLRRFGFGIIRHIPGQAMWIAKLQCRELRRNPQRFVRRAASHMATSDSVKLSEESVALPLGAHLAEACRAGPRGMGYDMKLLTQPWGFELPEITAPVDLFYGADDRNVPRPAGDYLAERLPNCRPRLRAGEGHVLSPLQYSGVLGALASDQAPVSQTSREGEPE